MDFNFGLSLVVMAGVANGVFVLPMKYARHWRWENTWLVYSLFAMIVVPWAVAAVSVPGVWLVYRDAGVPALAVALLCGVGWGVGAVLYGLAVKMVGMALTFAIVLGLTSAVGSLVPLVALHRERILSSEGLAVLSGIAISLVGITLCAIAGRLRTPEVPAKANNDPGRTASFGWGLMACIGSGLLSPLMNVSFAFGSEIISGAVAKGASPNCAANALWPLPLVTGFVINAGYCLRLLRREESWSCFRENRGNWLLGAAMGFLWNGAYVLYGMGGMHMGALAASIGWPITIAAAIVTANVAGIMTGEWRISLKKSSVTMALGVGFLVLSVFVIASGAKG